MQSQKKKMIDVEAALKEKNPKLYKSLPQFVINFIKRKIHQEFINDGCEIYKDKFHLDFNTAALDYMGAKVEWKGEEHVPQTGGVIIASNHPLGGLDGLALIRAVSSRRKDMRFLVNDLLTRFENFQDLFVAVNKVGINSKDALKIIDSVYASENAVLVFPAGLVSRKQNGVIMDLEWKKSFISKAIEYKKSIVPVFTDGKNSKFFYNLALWRKRFGIKANIEMFYLADEMVKQKDKKIAITFTQPVPYDFFDKRHTHLEWAQLMKKYIYQVKENPGISFQQFCEKNK